MSKAPNKKTDAYLTMFGSLKTDKRISTKQYNLELVEAEKRIADGNFIKQEELEKEAKKWK